MDPTSTPPTAKPRRPLRPLHGIPEPEKRSPAGPLISGLVHGAIILAMLLPALVSQVLLDPDQRGAGGAGPAGGGGGGLRGSGGAVRAERIRYLRLAPAPAPAAITPTRPTITPALPPPPPPPKPTPEAAVVKPEATPAPTTDGTAIPTNGAGGGSGTDGSGGTGPGRGGGIGAGVGTGRGSGDGPGTGGGGLDIFPPKVTYVGLLPMPIPKRVRPYNLVAAFEVDERGNARLISFNPTRDSDYNRKIREMLSEVRFSPATRADGTPVRDTAFIRAAAPH